MKQYRIILLLALLVGAFTPATIGAKANSAQHSFFGSYSSGVIVTDEDSPIVVTKEDLLFNIPDLPSNYEETLADYDSFVSATYTFHNPAAYDVTSRLVFPFGRQPDYIDSETFKTTINNYEIKLDGVETTKTIRHTFSSSYGGFNVADEIVRLRDEVQDDDFFNQTLDVNRYAVNVSVPTQGANVNLALEITVPSGFEGVILSPSHAGYQRKVNREVLRYYVNNNDSFYLFTLGDSFDNVASSIRIMDSFYEPTTLQGTTTLMSKISLELDDMLLYYYDETSGVSEIDYKNAVIDKLNNAMYYALYYDGLEFLNVKYQLLAWYDYSMTVNAGESVINQVVAPLFPNIHTDYEPSLFDYEYLLTPASTWAGFSNLTIEIVTPFYLINSTIPGFEKTTTGYKVVLESLPTHDLTFSISTGENPIRQNTGLSMALAMLASIGVVVLMFVFIVYALGGLALIIYFSVRASNKNTRNNQ